MTIYLYIKQHSITGLKYFGKTIQKDPFKYPGSGIRWKLHYKKHGKQHIKTLEIWGFDDQKLCTEFALKFSEENNIVESKEWANLTPENGSDGGITRKGFVSPNKGKPNYARRGIAAWNKGKPNSQPKTVHTEESKQKIRLANKNKTVSSEARKRMRDNHHRCNLGKPMSNETKLKMSAIHTGKIMPKNVCCIGCRQTLTKSSFTKYHLNKCQS